MADPFLGDALIFEDSRPVSWAPGPLPQGPELAHTNADNHQLLGAEASLEEARVHEALKDESQALVHELQRLEYKLNILLRLTAELSLRQNTMPAAQRVRFSSRGLEWIDTPAEVVLGATGLLQLYINPALPQPLRMPCRVDGERFMSGARIAQLRFSGQSEAVVEMLDKLIFRHHRRLIAGARQAPP